MFKNVAEIRKFVWNIWLIYFVILKYNSLVDFALKNVMVKEMEIPL